MPVPTQLTLKHWSGEEVDRSPSLSPQLLLPPLVGDALHGGASPPAGKRRCSSPATHDMGNFASSDASSVKEAQRVSATTCLLPHLISTPSPNLVPKDSRRNHWDSESIQDWLEMAESAGPWVYSCCHCRNHVCLHDDIISKAFQGRNGHAFLASHAINITMGAKEDRQFMTGLHTVADIHCRDCREVLGWKYERAYEESQKYKDGKFTWWPSYGPRWASSSTAWSHGRGGGFLKPPERC